MRKTVEHVNQPDAAEPSAEAVIESIHSVMHLYRASLFRESSADAQALTPMDGKVLGFFARHVGATQKELAEHSGRDKGQLARLISGLKDRGLIEGHADEADRRNIRLQLTADGRVAQRAMQAQARRVARRAVAILSGEERQQVVTLLSKVHAGLADPN